MLCWVFYIWALVGEHGTCVASYTDLQHLLVQLSPLQEFLTPLISGARYRGLWSEDGHVSELYPPTPRSLAVLCDCGCPQHKAERDEKQKGNCQNPLDSSDHTRALLALLFWGFGASGSQQQCCLWQGLACEQDREKKGGGEWKRTWAVPTVWLVGTLLCQSSDQRMETQLGTFGIFLHCAIPCLAYIKKPKEGSFIQGIN